MKNKEQQALIDVLKTTMGRNGINHNQMAKYLGVPRVTLDKWLAGERYPGSATLRLIEVLGIIETMSQDIHEMLIE